ncbi:MAG: hypothetical protein M1833_003766 [Piccolia ochrophora]|nr:MAG: hypothetical protein M1833_003766 [Piccolia ochrophora]
MRSLRSLTSTAQALHRVFVTPVRQPQYTSTSLFLPSRIQSCIHPTPPFTLQRRCISGKINRRKRDEEIGVKFVQVVNEDNFLDPPELLGNALASFDRSKNFLVQVDTPEPPQPPICKVIEKRKLREWERAKAKGPKGSGIVFKQLELNWAIDSNDLGHRLDRLQQFLEKGVRVEVLLATKRKGRQSTPEEAEALIKTIKKRVLEVPGAKETKPMEGQFPEQKDGRFRWQATLFFEGRGKQSV